MFTEHIIDEDEHEAWLKNLETDEKRIVFTVLLADRVVGVVSITALDHLHKKSDWAFYLDEHVRGGLGAALEFSLINYVFDSLGLEKLNCEVLETNPRVVKMHLKFGFLEEGFRRSNIEKDGIRIGVHLLGLTKADWLTKRKEIFDTYKSTFDKFLITIEDRKQKA